MEEIREFFVAQHRAFLPVAVISEWHKDDGPQDENLCMHYPDVGDPLEIHDFLRRAAARERLILAVDDAIKVDISENSGLCSQGVRIVDVGSLATTLIEPAVRW